MIGLLILVKTDLKQEQKAVTLDPLMQLLSLQHKQPMLLVQPNKVSHHQLKEL